MIKWFVINLFTGNILGPCDTQEDAEGQLKLVEFPNEWILVRSVNNIEL